MLKTYLEKLILQKNLTTAETTQAINCILNGANSAQSAAFLTLLRSKRETPDELVGLVNVMRAKMITVKFDKPVLDIVGTGGDCANTVNISTGAAILAASAGITVVKHGNRAVSSKCGSADLLEALGVNINMNPNVVSHCVEKVNFGFCFAPQYHPALNVLRQVRKDLGVPTCCNILGPLLNPANAQYLLLGVFNEDLLPLIAEVLVKLKISRALIFSGHGIDELSCIGTVRAIAINGTKQKECCLDPMKFGFSKCSIEDLKGGDAPLNAKILLEVFRGRKSAIADTIIFNAAVAVNLYGISQSIDHAVDIVTKSIALGKPLQLLEKLKYLSKEGAQ